MTVTAQRCERPMVRRGVGTDLGDGRVLTAGHVVSGDLRWLEVDGAPAELLALDARLDLALVALAGAPGASGATPPRFDATVDPGRVTIVTPDGTIDAGRARTIALRVDDVSAALVHERQALSIDIAVERGRSGAPVVDSHGVVVGVVVLSDLTGGVTYATRVPPPDETFTPVTLAPRNSCA